MGGDVFGHLVVLDRGQSRTDFRVEIVKVSLRRRRQQMNVDAGGIHILQAARDVVAAGRKRLVDHAVHVERREFRVVRRDRDLGAGLGQQGRCLQRQDMRVNVDRSWPGHFVP